MISILNSISVSKYNLTLLNNLMDINAVGMKTLIPVARFIPSKHYVSAWVCIMWMQFFWEDKELT